MSTVTERNPHSESRFLAAKSTFAWTLWGLLLGCLSCHTEFMIVLLDQGRKSREVMDHRPLILRGERASLALVCEDGE